MTATTVVKKMANAAQGGGGDERLGVERINGTVAPNQGAPRSDAPVAAANSAGATPGEQPAAEGPPVAAELKPNVADANELKPNVEPDPSALPPLQQNNQLDSGGTSSSASARGPAKTEEMADISSSQKKKKKGLKKLNPF
jgi:hypothetical protein